MATSQAQLEATWTAYFDGLRRGLPKSEAAREAGISIKTVHNFHSAVRGGNTGHYAYAVYRQMMFGYTELSMDARRALVDFEFFRRRYFGHISSRWQIEAAELIVSLLESVTKDYTVINAPPGVGKSTLFTHDIPAWVIVRDRTTRILLGHRVERQARLYVNRVKRSLETYIPPRAEPREMQLGLAMDATGTLPGDFGRFKPENSDRWRADELVVAQLDGLPVREKESTVTAYGMNSGVIGSRFDLEIWDDLVDLQNTRNAEQAEATVQFWEKVAERRLEPAGVLILQGQRLSSRDLYRHCLDKRVVQVGDDPDNAQPMYHHVVFKAHYTDRCKGEHEDTSPAWPDGCLLEPARLTWAELEPLSRDRPDEYATVYQQEDSDPASVLVNPLWIQGGRNPKTGEEFPGCLDDDRGTWEIPREMIARNDNVPAVRLSDCYAVITADPSPAKWWSVQAWIYHPETTTAWLIDHRRAKMGAPQLLDFVWANQQYEGLFEDWWVAFRKLGLPLSHMIVEYNGANRFLLQYDHVKRWLRERGVTLTAHTTGVNKSDAEFGVDSLSSQYKHGRYRLPGRLDAADAIRPLNVELTHYPDWTTDDCVMANWFLRWNADKLFQPRRSDAVRFNRPSWLRQAKRGLVLR